MKEILLTKGQVALVDDCDYEWLNQWNWYACSSNSTVPGFYARRTIKDTNGKKYNVYMHRLITGASRGVEVDHINHNKLDNRRENLRISSRSENNRNRKKQRNNTSGHKGVQWIKRLNVWCALIQINYKRVSLGHYRAYEDACNAYDNAASLYHGSFAYTERD